MYRGILWWITTHTQKMSEWKEQIYKQLCQKLSVLFFVFFFFFFFSFCVGMFLSHIVDQELKPQGKGSLCVPGTLEWDYLIRLLYFTRLKEFILDVIWIWHVTDVCLITSKCDFSQIYTGSVKMPCAVIGLSHIYF